MADLTTCDDGHLAVAYATRELYSRFDNDCPVCAARSHLSDAAVALGDAVNELENIAACETLEDAVELAKTALHDVRSAHRDAEERS